MRKLEWILLMQKGRKKERNTSHGTVCHLVCLSFGRYFHLSKKDKNLNTF